MLIGTAAAYHIPGTLVVSILVAADISSAGVGIPEMTTRNHITRACCYIRYKYSVQQNQVYAMLVRGRTWYLYILVYLVGYGPSAVCTVFYVGGRFDTPGAMPPCIVRNTYCMVHMGPFARSSGALAMSFFRARLLV